MKKWLASFLVFAIVATIFAGCNKAEPPVENPEDFSGTKIVLSDSGVTVDGVAASSGDSAVYVANDIVYYEEGHDFTYGEGTKEEAHSAAEAAAHTVVHITEPGQYVLSGKLSRGQIAVDLGEDAEDDPNAVVTLVLCGVDITCEVAPAIIFYSVYECGDKDQASATVDTTKAGANILLADGQENTANGSYVARIYKPGTVELSEDGTEVLDAKKLHKYDGAVYSKMSMNVHGSTAGTGVLNIHAENEGLDSELHLTINGGNINITSGNDGINTNEDGVSVTTINGGNLHILVNGTTGEGDGIDSNGWLVINGGTVIAEACATSGDAGIDSDMGIHINGGTVIATGNMLDRISNSKQNYAVFQFAQPAASDTYTLKNSDGEVIAQQKITNRFQYLIISTGNMSAGDYTLWQGASKLQGAVSDQMGGPGGMPGGQTPPDGMEMPDGMEPPAGGQQPPEPPTGGQQPPDGMGQPGQQPGGQFPNNAGTLSDTFPIQDRGSYFVSVQKVA